MYLNNNDVLGYERGGMSVLNKPTKPTFRDRLSNRSNDNHL